MCSEACPCAFDNYNEGGFDDIPADVLADFGRAPRLDETSDLLQLTTDLDTPSWDSLSLSTQAALTEQGFSESDQPAPVTNYEQCFNTII